MKTIIKNTKWVALAASAYAWVSVAMAQGGGGTQDITLTNPIGTQSFQDVTSSVLYFIYADIAIPLCIAMALVGGFQLMTSAGEPEKVSKGRKTLLYAAVGFVVVIVAGSLVTLIKNILGQ